MSAKKTIAALIAVLSIGMTFSACGSSSDSSSSAPAPTEAATEAPATTAEPTTEEVTTTKKVTTQKPTETPTEAPTEAESSGFSRGMRIGNTYQSPLANFKFNAPDGWVYKTDDEILAISGLAAEHFNREKEYEEYLDEQTMIIDAMAISENAAGTISFTFLNPEAAGEKMVSQQEAAEIIRNSLFSNPDYSDISEIRSFNLGKDEYLYFSAVLSSNGVGVYNTYALKTAGKYIFEITLTSPENNFEDYIKYFDCIIEESLF